jgi:hypothetical protein
MHSRRLTPFLMATAGLALLMPAGAQRKGVGEDVITAANLRAYLEFVASDEMEGRDTPSRGLNATAKFIATHLTRWGFKPGGDNNTFFQKIELVRSSTSPKSTFTLGDKSFVYGTDFVGPATAGSASAGLVYGGYGWLIKSKGMDPYKDVDPKGKIVILNSMNVFTLEGVSPSDLKGERGRDYADPVAYARQRGAAAIIYLTPSGSLPTGNQRAFMERRGLRVKRFSEEGEVGGLPTITVAASVGEALLAGEKLDYKSVTKLMTDRKPAEGFALSPEKRAAINMVVDVETQMTQNVVGIWEGSDKLLKDEYVAAGAHYDHVGVRQTATPPPPGTDVIFNGADDDGSGTVAILSMADALAHSKKRPKRSVIFVWHCGEEKGLWGSEYFTRWPTIPLKSIVTQLNIDMIGRSRAKDDTNPRNRELSVQNEVYVIGSKMMSTQLGELSERVNKAYLNLTLNYKYDDPKDPNRFFYRSDHYNYARNGVPIIFYFDGTHEDYHGLGDHADKIDYVKMENVTRTVYQTLWEIAELKDRPKVDKPTPK